MRHDRTSRTALRALQALFCAVACASMAPTFGCAGDDPGSADPAGAASNEALTQSFTLTGTNLTVSAGSVGSGQTVAALAVRDQSGSQDAWSKYVEFSPSTSAVVSYALPAGVTAASLSALSISVNYRGPKKATMRWTFEAWDATAGAWVAVGDNTFAADWAWTAGSLALPAPHARFVAAGAIKLRYATTSAADSSDLDQLVILGSSTTSGSTSAGTTTSTSTTAGAGGGTTGTTAGAGGGATSSSSTGGGGAGGSYWHPAVGTTWQWQLTDNTDLSFNVGAYDIDGANSTAATVAAIHAKGAKAICYIETGSWESYRSDSGSYPASVLGKTMGGYPDEKYVDIRQIAILKPIIDARLDMCKAKGFDAVEPDIDDSFVDVGAGAIGFPVTYADQIAFNKVVADDAHARGLAIALKNGVFGNNPSQFVNDMEALVDFAVEESCEAGGHVCGVLQVFTNHGKAVLHTEYLDEYPGATKANFQPTLNTFCPVTKPLGFSSILKNSSSSLDNWRAACP